MFHYNPTSNQQQGPAAARYVSFAIYVHKNEVTDFERFWSLHRHDIGSLFVNIEKSFGDYYESITTRDNIFNVTKESTVIVLGKYTNPELQELIEVRDFLKGRGYKAALIKEIIEVPMMSNEEKLRSWAVAARFCVMIDREPSGHIFEYGILKEQRCISAFLRPEGIGSTYMIGDAHLTDLNYIRNFIFKTSPLEVMDAAIEWSEGLIEARTNAYNQYYPWRNRIKNNTVKK
jgi:hypothetical protein